jgi:hypothetical protein
MSLDRKALLVHVHVRTWSARKFDRKVSDEITRAKGADPQAARVNKHLLGGKQDDHAAVIAAAGKLREVHYRLTLPWRDTGWRLLPTKLWMEYTKELRDGVDAFNKAVSVFNTNYHALRGMAALKMGDLFNSEDYPDEVLSRFGVKLSHMPVPTAGDFRLELDDVLVANIQEETERQVKEGVSEAMRDVWERLHGVVDKLAGKLEDPQGIFRDSLLDNVRAMVALSEKLNLTDNPHLEEVRKEAEELLSPPDMLRKNKVVRADAAARARALADRMRGVLG